MSDNPEPPLKCQDCDGYGWTVVPVMRSYAAPGPDGEPEQRWAPQPEQQQCERCRGTGVI